ncbi:MAG: DUF3078 domain-containing protein [Candidatus Zixiibacteriota bacterium]
MLRKLLFAILLFMFGAATLLAEEVNVDSLIALHWQKTMALDITAAQAAYSDSWVGGEAGTFAWVSNLNAKMERRFSQKFNFKLNLRLAFGQTTVQDEESKSWSKPKKSTDLIDWENVATFPLEAFVDPYLAVRFESQFLDASVAEKKRYFNPKKLTYSGGIARVFYRKEKGELTSRLGMALRQLMHNDIVNLETLETKSSTDTDGGIESVTDAQFELSKRVQYIGKLSMFKGLFSSISDDVEGTEFEGFWKAVDVNFENTLKVSVSKIMTVILYNQFLYDKEITKKGRIKQTMGVGLTFTMW